MEKHKWHDVICAWAEGKLIEFRIGESRWTVFDLDNQCGPWWNNSHPQIEWRIKPSYPTLGSIAKDAWYNHSCNPPNMSCWDRCANAVKQAITSGEYADASGEYSE